MVFSTEYYDILNIKPNSTEREIKTSYFKLSKKYHPDKNSSPESVQKFQEISEAYQILSDPEKRKLYDMYGKDFENRNQVPQDPFGGLFGNMFGFGQNQNIKGSPVNIELLITLEDVFNGTKKTINFDKFVPCNSCEGIGSNKSGSRVHCEGCNGSGKTMRTTNMGFITTNTVTMCDLCKGTGKLIKEEDKCTNCNGKCVVKDSITKNIEIPKGIPDNVSICIENEGNLEQNCRVPGDLIIKIKTEKHSLFTRDKNDLTIKVNVPLYEALTRYSINFVHLDGKEYNISGDARTRVLRDGLYCFNGEGISSNGSRGDLYVQISIKYPDDLILSSEEDQLLRKILKFDPKPKEYNNSVNIDFNFLEFINVEDMDEEEDQNYSKHEHNQGQCVHQ